LGTKAELKGVLVQELPLSTLKSLKNVLLKDAKRGPGRGVGMKKWTDRHAETRKKLDETMLAFRLARRAVGETKGCLRAVRQAVGIPVDEVARRLGVCRWEVFRLEKSESESRIMLNTLRRAAAALDCELVYGLTPREGTLEELAAAQKAAHEKALEESHEKRRAEAKATEEKVLKQIGWRKAFLKDLRRGLRKAGMKVR
jgi:predicted DNA-binding mobile mystery protein A